MDSNDILQKLYSRDIRESLDTAIDRLPPRCREIFLMNYVENLSAREIGEKLGISVSTVENQIHTALVRLRAFIKKSNFL